MHYAGDDEQRQIRMMQQDAACHPRQDSSAKSTSKMQSLAARLRASSQFGSFRFLKPIEHLAGARHYEHSFVLTSLPFFGMDAGGIEVSQVDTSAALLRNARRQRNLNA